MYRNREHHDVKSLIGTIISDLNGSRNLKDGLLSLVLHGGAPLFEDEDTYLDVDIVFLYKDEAIPVALRAIAETFTRLCYDLNKFDNKAFFAIKSGPMHPLREKETDPLSNINKQRIIFFHISVFSESGYVGINTTATASPLLVYRWQHLRPIFGQPLSDFRSVDKLTVDDVISAGLGIDNTIFMLMNREKGYWTWKDNNMVWCKEHFKDFDDYEMIVYALKWCINNSLSHLSHFLPISLTQERMTDVFAIYFLNQSLLTDYYSIIDFKSNIKNYRKQFVENPERFRELFDIEKLTGIVISILNGTKEKLRYIQKIWTYEYRSTSPNKEDQMV